MANPYSTLPDYSFWSRSVASVGPGMLDPMVGFFPIGRQEKVATIGSCFAQHLSKHITKVGLNYYVEESAPPEMNADLGKKRNYGVFSARYGNVYTVRQALQLFRRAFGQFEPVEEAWKYQTGYVDPFRPQIEPEPFVSLASLRASRKVHLEHVQKMFRSADWLVFTLGLTEAWASLQDGAVFPTAPGVHGGEFDPSRHAFVNFSISEVISDLREFITEIRRVNPSMKFILTVSPVPLIATYEDRHVLTSTVCSKSILRVAADCLERELNDVFYFPSYEIITSPVVGSYFLDDLREVSPLGVRHVMRVFTKHFVEGSDETSWNSTEAGGLDLRMGGDSGIVCDEEVIERALRAGGLK